MGSQKTVTRWRATLSSFLAFLTLASAAQAQREITIHLKSGTELEARYASIEADRLVYSRGDNASVQNRLPAAQIDWVDFPMPEEYSDAETAFLEQRFDDAAKTFEKIAKQTRTSEYFYPIPGNYAMLAKRRLIDCYRRLARPYDVHYHLRDLKVEALPKDHREFSQSIPVWEAAGRKGWDDVLELAAARKLDTPATSQDGCEIAYLTGLAHEAKGDPHKALLGYSQAYSLNGATDTVVARVALIAAARLLEAADPLSDDEKEDIEKALLAQVQVYSNIFGKGQLWGDASGRLTALSDVVIEIAGAAPEDDASKAASKEAKREAEKAALAMEENGDPTAPKEGEEPTLVAVAAAPKEVWKVTGPSILTNGSFETKADNGAPASWEMEAMAGEIQAGIAPDAKDGESSVMVRLAENGQGGWGMGDLQLKKNSNYRLSGWIRTAGIKDQRKGATLMLEDDNLQILGETKVLLGDNDWTRVEVRFNSGEGGSFKAYCLLASAGTAWFDNIELVPLAKEGEEEEK